MESPDEQAILDYLKGWTSTFVSAKEIARKVGGKERYEKDRGWALPVLAQLCRFGLVETDQYGCYRLFQKEEEEPKTFVSPQILKILKSSGKNFDSVNLGAAEDEPSVPAYRPRSPQSAPLDKKKP